MTGEIFESVLTSTDGEQAIPNKLATTFDAILVLGGGVPTSADEPPVYVIERCSIAAQLFNLAVDENRRPPSILTLSAGTAHLPQLLSGDGLPIWESTASAAYLIDKLGIPEQYVFAETTSYDTISNAFFARTSFCDIVNWRRLLIVTNEFHVERTKAIFDWIFNAENQLGDPSQYELYYFSCRNVGLTDEAVETRKERESKSAQNVRERLSKQYTTLHGVWEFLTQNHDFYNAKKMTLRAKQKVDNSNLDAKTLALIESYGRLKSSTNIVGGRPVSPFFQGMLTGLAFAAVIFILGGRKGYGKPHAK